MQTLANQPRLRPWAVALLTIVLLLGIVAAVNQTRPPRTIAKSPPQTGPAPVLTSPTPAPTPAPPFSLEPAPTPRPATIQALAYLEPGIGPISFYMAKCASCHGAYGSYYYENDILAEGRGQAPLDGLLSQVRLMVETNAQVNLSESQIRALAAYASTFPDVADTDAAVDGPFIALTGWSPDDHVLRGEVTPKSSVAIEIPGNKPTPATVTGHQWTASLAPGIDPGQAVVVATLDGKEVRLLLAPVPDPLGQPTFAIPH